VALLNISEVQKTSVKRKYALHCELPFWCWEIFRISLSTSNSL